MDFQWTSIYRKNFVSFLLPFLTPLVKIVTPLHILFDFAEEIH